MGPIFRKVAGPEIFENSKVGDRSDEGTSVNLQF